MSVRPASSSAGSDTGDQAGATRVARRATRVFSRASLGERISLGASCVVPSAVLAEALGRSGLDYVTLDLQHGLIGFESMVAMLQALAISPVLALVRVPVNDVAEIGRALDAGAGGVVVPMVGSATEAEAAVAAVRHPPVGRRSWGPTRAAWPGRVATDPPEGLLFVMIETAGALTRTEEIVRTPGVDGVILGTSDLAVSLGLGPGDHLHPSVRDAASEVARACRNAGAVAGIGAQTIEQARAWSDAGFRMLSLGRDLGFVTDGVRARLQEYRELVDR